MKPGGTSVTDFYISDIDIPIYFTILLPQGYSYVHVEQKQEIWGKKISCIFIEVNLNVQRDE